MKNGGAMIAHFELLKNVLIEIERCIGTHIDAASLADRFSLFCLFCYDIITNTLKKQSAA